MVSKSSRQPISGFGSEAQRWEYYRRLSRLPWQIESLEDAGLERILLVQDGPLFAAVEQSEQGSESTSEAENNSEDELEVGSDMEHSSTWPVKRGVKQHESRISFLDLPAEIRISIYDFYCQAVLKESDYNHMPAMIDDICKGRPARSLQPRLLCHQIRDEYSPIWAQCQTFLLSGTFGYPDRFYHQPWQFLDGTWCYVCKFLEWMGPAARQHVRSIRVLHIWRVDYQYYTSDDDWQAWAPVLQASTADRILSCFERIADVHQDLRIEVELRYLSQEESSFRAMRRIFTLRQSPYGRQTIPDWTIDVGDVQTIKIQSDLKHISEICDRPNSSCCRDQAWKTEG